MSTSAENGDILQKMANFDFNAPMSGTILFDDFEEDIKPKENIDNAINNNIDKIVTETLDDIIRISQDTELLEKQKRKKTKYSRLLSILSDQNKSKKQKTSSISHEEPVFNDQSIISLDDKSPSVLNNKSETTLKTLKHTWRNQAQKTTQTLALNNQATFLGDDMRNILNDQAHPLPENQGLPLNNQKQAALDNQSSSYCNHSSFNQNQINIAGSPNLVSQVSKIQHQEYFNSKAGECLKTLLNTVSTHMILIMKSYADYAMLYKRPDRNVLSNEIESAKCHYQHTKSHFFYLSYSAVINIIIPQENDEAFVKNFIEDTVKLSNDKHYYFTYIQMRRVFGDMIRWVKIQRQAVEAVNYNSQHPPSQINFPLSANYNRSALPADRTCNIRHEPAANDSHSNVPNVAVPKPTQQYNNSAQSVSTINNFSRSYEEQSWAALSARRHTSEPVAKIARNIPPGQNYEQGRTRDTQYKPSETTEQCSRVVQTIESQSTGISSFNQQFQSFQLEYLNYQETEAARKIPEKKTQRQTQPKPKKPKHQVKTPQTSVTAVTHTEAAPTSEIHCLLDPLPAYSSDTSIPLEKTTRDLMLSPQLNINFQQDCQTGESIRSLSRDSGFMSPQPSATDPMLTPRIDQSEESPTMSPTITHVTSLNPSVTFIKVGNCHVCYKPTKHMCLGCFKEYYCSSSCQIKDWLNHMYSCRK